jgi:hypothetical protein
MKIHRTRVRTTMAFATVAAALLAAIVTGGASAAHADPLSPQTGARVATSGTPSASGGGTVYYVDAIAGADSNNGTSTGTAWKTLSKVTAASFSPGDVIAFKRGQTFIGSATLAEAGTASKPIIATAYGSGAQPILTNPGGLNMLVLNAAHTQVKNLAFTAGAEFTGAFTLTNYENSGAVLVTASGANALVEDATFTDVGIGVKTYGLNSKVWHNTFKDLRIAYRGTDGTVETSYGAIGVSANNSGIRIAFNDFINCRSTNSPYGADGGAIEIEGFQFDKNNITIDHNYSRGSQGFLEVTETNSSNVTLSYNVSDDYQQFIAWDTTTTPANYLAVNNTVVRQFDNSRLFDQYYYREEGPAPAANWITIRNNIFVANSWFSIYDFPKDHNLYSSGIGLGSGSGNPGFVNQTGHDLQLTATSNALNNGAPSSETIDLRGNPTTVGLATDMGAMERQSNPAAGSNILADGGFESQTAITPTSSPWFSEGSLSYGVDQNVGNARSGQDNAWISTSGTTWGAVKQTVTVAPNSTYRLTVWVRSSAVSNNAWIGVKTNAGAVLGEVRHGKSDAAYSRYVVTFVSGANTSLTIHIGAWGSGAGTWERIDDVAIQKL